jgi:lipoprotein-releasing system ATP-binding protein
MILEAKGIVKRFGSTEVLSGISFTAEESCSIAISGRSGSGKTTLLHILGALDLPTEGTVLIRGRPATLASRRTDIGFVFQGAHLLEDFTAIENVLLPSRIARNPLSRVEGLQLLSEVGLDGKADLKAKHLSGGEKQRVAIARALCNQPAILLADEPTGSLDRIQADAIGTLLLSLKRCLIIATHDTDLANRCQRRLLLADGLI